MENDNGRDGHRQRLRERFLRVGLEGFADHEVMELLLTYAIHRRDCKPLARRLLERFGSLPGVLGAGPRDLAAVDGMGPAAAGLVALVPALSARCLRERIRDRHYARSATEVVQYLRLALGSLKDEVLLVLLLNARNEILADVVVQEGTVDQAAVYPRKVLEPALEHKAAALVLVHNHPGGGLTPSATDRRITRELVRAAEALQVRVHDHLVVTGEGHFSFAEHGLM